MIKVHLKDNIYIGYKNDFITVHQKLVKGDDSKNAGEEYYAPTLTYSKAISAAKDIFKRFNVTASRNDVTNAFNQSKRDSLIEVAKMPKKGFGKKAGDL